MASDKIKRNFVWLRRVLGIIDKTTLPGEILGDVRPTMDLFGWDRLAEASSFSASAVAAPGFLVNGPITPEGVVRLVLNASVRHTDTGVSMFMFIDKDMRGTSAELVGVTTPYVQLPPNVDASADRWLTLAPRHRLRGRAEAALVAGALTLSFEFIDLPIGEYIPL